MSWSCACLIDMSSPLKHNASANRLRLSSRGMVRDINQLHTVVSSTPSAIAAVNGLCASVSIQYRKTVEMSVIIHPIRIAANGPLVTAQC